MNVTISVLCSSRFRPPLAELLLLGGSLFDLTNVMLQNNFIRRDGCELSCNFAPDLSTPLDVQDDFAPCIDIKRNIASLFAIVTIDSMALEFYKSSLMKDQT